MAKVGRWLSLLLISLWLGGCGEGHTGPLKVGAVPPPIAVERLEDGRRVTLRYPGRLLVLNVWAPWCPPCIDEMPALQRLSEQLAEEHFKVVGLTLDDRYLAEEFLVRAGISFENYYDPSGSLVREGLGITVFPQTLIIAPDGRLLSLVVGWRPWDDPDSIKNLERLYRESRNKGTSE